MKIKSIEWWNSLPKTQDTNTEAEEGDSVVLINGIAFLIQRKNDFNNIVCLKVKSSKKEIIKIFSTFRAWCQRQNIQYIRVEGRGKHHYKMLALLYRCSPEGADMLYAEEESIRLNRHVWYIKTY